VLTYQRSTKTITKQGSFRQTDKYEIMCRVIFHSVGFCCYDHMSTNRVMSDMLLYIFLMNKGNISEFVLLY